MMYIFDTPITLGDLQNQLTIDALELASVAFNFEPYYADKGEAIVSIVLVHRGTGHKENFIYNGTDGKSFTDVLKVSDFAAKSVEQIIFEKLIGDGKLRGGRIQ